MLYDRKKYTVLLISFVIGGFNLSIAQQWRSINGDRENSSYIAPLRSYVFEEVEHNGLKYGRTFNNYGTFGVDFELPNIKQLNLNYRSIDSLLYQSNDKIFLFDAIGRQLFNLGSIADRIKAFGDEYTSITKKSGDWCSDMVAFLGKTINGEGVHDVFYINKGDTIKVLSNLKDFVSGEYYQTQFFHVDNDLFFVYDTGVQFDGDSPPRISKWTSSGWEQVGVNEPEFRNPYFLKRVNGILVLGSEDNTDVLGNPTSLLKLENDVLWRSLNTQDLTGAITKGYVYRGNLFFVESKTLGLFTTRERIWQYSLTKGMRIIAGSNNEFVGLLRLRNMFPFQDEIYCSGDLFVLDTNNDTIPYNAKFPIEKWDEANLAPVAMSDQAVWSTKDDSVIVDVLANDNAMDGDFLKYTIVQEPKGGEYQILYDGTLVYYPFNDTWYDTIRYEVCDQLGACDQSVVYFTRDRRDFGLDDQSLCRINVYPNPANTVLHIESGIEIGRITIVDLLGKVVRTMDLAQNVAEINVSNLNNGMYFIHITDSKGEVLKNAPIHITH